MNYRESVVERDRLGADIVAKGSQAKPSEHLAFLKLAAAVSRHQEKHFDNLCGAVSLLLFTKSHSVRERRAIEASALRALRAAEGRVK